MPVQTRSQTRAAKPAEWDNTNSLDELWTVLKRNTKPAVNKQPAKKVSRKNKSVNKIHNMNLLKGDCLAVLPTIPDKSIDLVLLDLPYGQTDCSWDTCIDLQALWTQLKRVGKQNTAYIFFCTTKFGN